MCVEAMSTTMKNEVFRSSWARRTATNKPPSKWRLRKHLPLNSEEEACKPWRTNVGKATIRKYIRHEQKRRQLAKLVKKELLIENEEKVSSNATERNNDRVSEQPRPRGAMAPGNTTQYLMDIVYDDLPETSDMFRAHAASCEKYLCNNSSLSHRIARVSYDNDYESSLAFQQSEFEEALRHFGSH